jgi:hypothetical protein
MKKIFKEIYDMAWLWAPALILMSIVFGYLYFHAHYCKEIPYDATCKHCIRWELKSNDMQGKYRREWEECAEYEYYDCIRTYDSCGCTKLK